MRSLTLPLALPLAIRKPNPVTKVHLNYGALKTVAVIATNRLTADCDVLLPGLLTSPFATPEAD